MYLPSPNGGVQALDAATGELLWSYKKDIESQEPPLLPDYTWDDFSWHAQPRDLRRQDLHGDARRAHPGARRPQRQGRVGSRPSPTTSRATAIRAARSS